MYSSYSTDTFAGMPTPLAEICQILHDIAWTTEEVVRENISP
jgi:hypothetical protein